MKMNKETVAKINAWMRDNNKSGREAAEHFGVTKAALYSGRNYWRKKNPEIFEEPVQKVQDVAPRKKFKKRQSMKGPAYVDLIHVPKVDDSANVMVVVCTIDKLKTVIGGLQ